MNKTSPTLRELQRWMLWAVTDPRGAGAALEDPERPDLGARYHAPTPCAREVIGETENVSKSQRLDVYAEAYFARIAESLAEDFASVNAVLGETQFLKLVADFLKKYPSRSTNINEIGASLSEFAVEVLAGSPSLAENYPYLPDLCRLEWLQMEAFHATDSTPFDASRLAQRTDEEWSNAKFVFSSGVAVLDSRWAVEAIRQNPEEDAIETNDSHYLISRTGCHIGTRAIGRIEALVLTRLKNGATLDGALAFETEEESAAADLSAWFGTWITQGLIQDIVF